MWRGLTVWAAVCVVAAGLLLERMAMAQPTVEQLRAAALTLDDVGPGFRQGVTIDLPPESTGYTVQYVRAAPSLAVVGVLLVVDDGQSVVDTVHAATRGFTMAGSLQVADAPAPWVGVDTAKLTVTGEVSGVSINGEVLGWRQRETVALVYVLGAGTVDVLPYADLQNARLILTLSPAVSCAAFVYQEEAQAALTITPGDPYGLDADGNGRACDDLPSRPPISDTTIAATPAPTSTPAPIATPPPSPRATPGSIEPSSARAPQ